MKYNLTLTFKKNNEIVRVSIQNIGGKKLVDFVNEKNAIFGENTKINNNKNKLFNRQIFYNLRKRPDTASEYWKNIIEFEIL